VDDIGGRIGPAGPARIPEDGTSRFCLDSAGVVLEPTSPNIDRLVGRCNSLIPRVIWNWNEAIVTDNKLRT